MNESKLTIKVNKELINLFYKHFHFLLIGESLGAIVFVMLLWSEIDHKILLSWLLLNLIINGLSRHILTFCYHRYKRVTKSISIWNHLLILTALASGIVWGLGACLSLLAVDDLHRILIALIMIAIAGTANAVFIPNRSGFLAFVIPIYLSLLVTLITHNTFIYLLLSTGVLILMVLSIKLSIDSSNTMVNSLWFQFKNEELLQNISEAKNELEIIHKKLVIEIKARQEAETILQKLATYDYLTGLPNRRLMRIQLSHAIAKSKLNKTNLALLFIDLDYFKKINDSFGHDVGDKVLIEAGKRLQSSIRSIDTIARLGGDEFCIIINDIHNINEINAIAKRLCTSLAQPFIIVDHKIGISISVGISVFPKDGTDIYSLFKNADRALYNAKNEGRNKYRYFDENMLSSKA